MDEVDAVMNDMTHHLFHPINALFTTLRETGESHGSSYHEWKRAMTKIPRAVTQRAGKETTPGLLWASDFELNLWGLFHNRPIFIFKLAGNETGNCMTCNGKHNGSFICNGDGNVFGSHDEKAMQIFLALVSARLPVCEGMEHDAYCPYWVSPACLHMIPHLSQLLRLTRPYTVSFIRVTQLFPDK